MSPAGVTSSCATGAPASDRWTFDFPERVTPVALKPDGTVLAVGGNRVWAWAPGSPPRTVGSHTRRHRAVRR